MAQRRPKSTSSIRKRWRSLATEPLWAGKRAGAGGSREGAPATPCCTALRTMRACSALHSLSGQSLDPPLA